MEKLPRVLKTRSTVLLHPMERETIRRLKEQGCDFSNLPFSVTEEKEEKTNTEK